MRVYAAYPTDLLVAGAGAVRSIGIDDADAVATVGDRVLVGTGTGVHVGTDAGRSIERADLAGDVTALAVGPDGTAWAGTEPSAVHRSTDGGRTWTERPGLTDLPSAASWAFPPRPETHHVRAIAVAPDDPADLYVAIEAGALVRTTDGGATWRDRTADGPRDTHGTATHPAVPDRLWAAAGDGFAVTTDRGETWRFAETGLDHTYCWSVAVDPGDPDRLLCSAASGPRVAHAEPGEAYVYRRTDGATGDGRWRRIEREGLPTGRGITRPVLAAGSDPGTCLAASNAGLFRTDDWGESWRRLADAPAGATTCRGLAVAGEE